MSTSQQEPASIGPVIGESPVTDNFTFEDVRESHCVAQISENVCRSLIEHAQITGKKYLTVCCPAYNEEFEEMMKTLLSLMNSFDFMKNETHNLREFKDPALLQEFQDVVSVIVPIFDGTRAISASMSAVCLWLGARVTQRQTSSFDSS